MQEAEPKWISPGAFLAVGAAYAAFRELSNFLAFAPWNVFAPVRLAALLLVPRRFWPALVVGEWLPVLVNGALSEQDFGLDWALLVSMPVIAFCMPVVMLASRFGQLRRRDGELNIGWLLAVTLACALINATMSDIAFMSAVAASPDAWPEVNARDGFFIYLLGCFPGPLTFAASLLAIREVVETRAYGIWRRVLKNPLNVALVAVSVATWAAAAVFAPDTPGTVLQAIRMATLLPVMALTLRFGWQGAAPAGLIASIVIACTSTAWFDLPLLHAQIVMALVVSGSLLIGLPVTRRRRALQDRRFQKTTTSS